MSKKLNEIQTIELDMFKVLLAFLKKEKIDYFIAGGTLLGAVRHKGFIPWDDDIDIVLLRDQYDKFCNALKKNRYLDKNKRYKVLLPLDKGYIYPYSKVIDTTTIAYEKSIKKEYATGVWLDIFPYDYCCDTEEEIKKLCKKHDWYKRFFQVGISGELTTGQKILKAIAYIPYKIMTRGDYTYWTKKILAMPKKEKTKYTGCVVWKRDEKDFFPTEWFDEYIELPFEDIKVRSIKKYDEWLTHFYGDYMTPPKEEDRQVHGYEWQYVKKDKTNE